MIKTLFFDMDGTLVDTELAAAKAIEEAFSTWGHTVAPKDADFVTGRTWEKALEFLFSKYPPGVELQIAAQHILSLYRKRIESDLIEVPGARQAVLALAEEYPLALVSGSYRKEIHMVLDRLGIRSCFKTVLGAEDYQQSKPSPEGYLKALQLLGANPRQTLVFEDSRAGVESGLAAGLQVCVITSTHREGDEPPRGHFFIEDLRGVDPNWVKALRAPANSG